MQFLADHHLFTIFLTILIFYPIFEFIYDKFKISNIKWMYYWQLFSFIILFLILIVIIIITYLSFNPAYCSDNLENLVKSMKSTLEKALEIINKNDVNKFLGNFNVEDLYKYLDSLSVFKEHALLHIFILIALVLIVLNIVAVFFSNELLKYFDIEQKYPSLATFFKLRAKYQRYYLMWNCLLLIILCFLGIGINIFVVFFT
jgi:uncharacterized membrane protein